MVLADIKAYRNMLEWAPESLWKVTDAETQESYKNIYKVLRNMCHSVSIHFGLQSFWEDNGAKKQDEEKSYEEYMKSVRIYKRDGLHSET